MTALTKTRTARTGRLPRWRALTAAVAVLSMSAAGLAAGSSAALAASSPRTPATGPCNVTVSAGTGVVAGTYIVGVTAGTTTLTFDCDASATPAIAAEASLLAGVGSTSVMLASEADVSALAQFTASATDTGCPSGSGCAVATFAVPATFTAADSQATCPPSAAQINAGLFGCVVAVADATQQPLPGAEYLMTYASQTTPPTAPSIATTVTAGPPGSTITIGDAANAGAWWGNAVQTSQAVALQMAPMAAPATCGAGGGYGAVPSVFLGVRWFAQGSTTPVSGDASGVTISNACYDSHALSAPALSGTIPVPSSLTIGTAYTAYLCELNVTPFPSNDAGAAANCGPSAPGTSWIDASFAFTPTAGTPQAALSVTSASGVVGTPLTLATGGGSGTGALSYTAVNGTASGCAATGATLSATSAGTCFVTATKASDSSYLAVSSLPTLVSFTAPAKLTLLTTRAVLKPTATTLKLKFRCANAACKGSMSVTTSIRKSVRVGAKTVTKTVSLPLGTASYSFAAATTGAVTIRLTAFARAYLKATPTRPTLQATVTVTDNLGKKHTIGRVSLLK